MSVAKWLRRAPENKQQLGTWLIARIRDRERERQRIGQAKNIATEIIIKANERAKSVIDDVIRLISSGQ